MHKRCHLLMSLPVQQTEEQASTQVDGDDKAGWGWDGGTPLIWGGERGQGVTPFLLICALVSVQMDLDDGGDQV